MAQLLPFVISEKPHEVAKYHGLWPVSFTDFVWREGKCVSGAGDELCHSPTSCGGRGNACQEWVMACVIHRLRVAMGVEEARRCGKRGRGRAQVVGDVKTRLGLGGEAAWKPGWAWV